MAVAGLGNVGGLLLFYAALRRGKVAIIAPIASTEGAIAAVLAVAAGETLGLPSALLLAAIAVGVVLASMTAAHEGGSHTLAATLLAAAAATSFGASLFATGKVSTALPLVWAVLPPRLVGVLVVALPSLAVGGLRIARAAVPFVVFSGVLEVVGFASFAIGARHGVAVSAVVTSQAAAVAAVAAYVLLHERLRPVQVTGIAITAVAVAALTAVRS